MKIAITGKMCSGKTTLSNYLCQLEPRFQIFSFGKKVKEVAITLFNMDPFLLKIKLKFSFINEIFFKVIISCNFNVIYSIIIYFIYIFIYHYSKYR